MPIYRIDNRNILFIHVPKTGGTTVEKFFSQHASTSFRSRGAKLLRPAGSRLWRRGLPLQHFHAALLEKMFAPDFFDYSFMIVRDPLERLKSEYRHSRRLGRADAFLSFSIWAELALRAAAVEPAMRSNHFRPQVDFRCFHAEIFRFEEGMEKILGAISSRTGLPPPTTIPHERRSTYVRVDVTARALHRVRDYYAADYESFGY